VTCANVHDSQPFPHLISESDQEVWVDSAYVGEGIEDKLKEKNPDIKLHIIEKRYRNAPLTDVQASNKEKSRIRYRVGHVFGFKTQSGADDGADIGKAWATREIAMKNLAYNLKRYAFLEDSKK